MKIGSVLLLFLFTFSGHCQIIYEYLITNVKVFDGDSVFTDKNLGIVDGRIYYRQDSAESEITIDGSGKTLIPGLVNAHVHLWFPNNLKQALQAGVFASLDMHTNSRGMQWMKSYADSTDYGYYFAAGSGATVPGGHGTQYGIPVPVIGDTLSPADYVKGQVDQGADYIKILREPRRPTITFDQIDTVIQAAHEWNKKAVAHVSMKDDGVKLASVNIDGLVHIWNDTLASPSEMQEIKNADMFIVPTLIVLQKLYGMLEEQDKPNNGLAMDQILSQVKMAHDLGIPIVAGTDAPNFGLNYGEDYYLELYLLKEAGLTNLEVLKSATSRGADAFGLKGLGRITEGGPANCILIGGDVMEDLTKVENIDGVWRSGKKVK